MKTSLKGICAILSHEAIVKTTYNDGVGVLTIGAGHTAMAGPPTPRPGMRISLVEAINIFRQDLSKFEQDVNEAVSVPLDQHQFDALVSWHFNTGSIKSATLTKKLNKKDYKGASKEFARWNKAKGKVLQGLVNRRKYETDLFVNGNYGNPKVPVYETKGGAAKVLDFDDIEARFARDSTNEEEQTTEELLRNPNSRLLPKFRPRQSPAVSRATVQKFLELVPEGRRDDAVKVLAVRGYYTDTMGKAGQNDRGLYDDAIFVIEPDGVHNFNGNTDPSRHRRGIAQLKAPQAVRYKPGPHGYKRRGGPYPAFRQDSNCTVIRDQTGPDTGMFYINLHRGGNTTTSSLGCQTVPVHQWNEFKALVDGLLDRHGQSTFYYIIVNDEDVAKEVPAMSEQPVTKTDATTALAGRGGSDLLTILTTAAALAASVKRLKEGKSATEAKPDADKSDDLDLARILQLVTAIASEDKPETKPAAEPAKSEPAAAKPAAEKELTAVNSALGTTIGKLLDGKKTGIGVIGLLATTILPMFFPALAPIAPLAKAVIPDAPNIAGSSILGSIGPIFTALTGWGILGKVDKWVNKIKK